MPSPLRITAVAGSLRAESLNRRLLDELVVALHAAGADVDVLDLRSEHLPMYDADLQARDGLPRFALDAHDRIARSDAFVAVNPEYNGSFPAVFKNFIDWVSRADMLLLHPRLVGLASATPGGKAGRRGLEHTRDLFANMFVDVHTDLLGVGHAAEVFGDDALLADLRSSLERWAGGFVEAARTKRQA